MADAPPKQPHHNSRGAQAIRRKKVHLLNALTRLAFTVLSGALMLLAACILIYAGWRMSGIIRVPEIDIGSVLLESVGFTVISLAVFEVAKYIFEEEVVNPREMRHASEARRGITKFISTIAIAVFLEALVLIFATGKDNVELMLYPILLLFAGVSLMVGLGAFQRLSAAAERRVGDPDPEAEPEPDR